MDRSILYNIEPIGIGTPFVESLTSYITRLAEAHCVLTGDLISKVYAPLLNKEYLSSISKRGGNGFFDSAIGINGLGKLAQEFSGLTNKFTGRTDLGFTTLQNWSDVLPYRGLLKKTKSWCPKCYEEFKLNDEVIYDPIIWNFQQINYCMKHKTPLVNICGNCNKTVPVINRKSAPGLCSRCENWLGLGLAFSSPTNVGLKADVTESISQILLIGEMLSQENLKFSTNKVSESLVFYINEVFDKSPTKAANFLSVPRSTFMTWISGSTLPSIHYLVQICNRLGISIIGFLQKQVYVKKLGPSYSVASVRKRYDHEEIQKILNSAIRENSSISISGVAKIIGCDRKLLSKMYPKECR